MESPASRLLRNARREATAVLVIWFGFLVWVIAWCTILGYQESGGAGAATHQSPETGNDHIILRAGVPLWIFWGIAIPWLVATLFTVFFGVRLLRDDDLGVERENVKETG